MLARLPSLTARELIRVLEQAGFCFDRQNGSHATYRHPVTRRTTLIPIHTGELARWLMKKIIKDAGLSEADIRDLL